MMREYLGARLAAAVRTLDPDFAGEAPLELPKVEAHGDLATPVALGLARTLKRPPRAIAEELRGALELDADLCTATVAGPGFLNFSFTPVFFSGALATMLREGETAGRRADTGLRANVEYVSANPTGLLHLGHGRQAAIGDTVANLLAWSGYRVDREYYFNNAGRQMRMLAQSIHWHYAILNGRTMQAPGKPPGELPDDYYHGEYVRTIAAELHTAHGAALVEETEEHLRTIQKFGEQWCFTRIRATLERMGVRHDVYFNEDSLYAEHKIDAVVAELRRQGLAYDREGAVWFKLDGFGLEDRVIVKSTGEPTYRLPDIAYHVEKLRRGYDLLVDVFGTDHQVTIPDVLAGVRALGFDADKVKVFIHGWVNLFEHGEAVKMSKRTGRAYQLDDLLDEFGPDVVRYFLVMRSASAPLDFDLDLARDQSEKNPVYYLQYAHARIAGILRVAARADVVVDDAGAVDCAPLVAREEQHLIRTLVRFPDLVAHAAATFEPHVICEYLKDVAGEFHKFYHDHRVVGVEPALSRARLALCIATLRVLRNGLTILGISAPERMERPEPRPA